MTKLFFATLLALGALLGSAPAEAQTTRDQIRMIEQQYARNNDGRMIPDNQLEYYLDQLGSGWTMGQVSRDIADAGDSDADSDADDDADDDWRPRAGWVAREVVCSSVDRRYTECRVPFRGTAVITQQISEAACVEGRSWGNKSGAVWVNLGCRARFGIVRTAPAPVPGNSRMVVCQSNQGRYRECPTGFRGRVQLASRLNNSAACVEGRTWGQREGTVWVSRGCRAQFASVGRPGRRDDNDWDRGYSVTCASTDGTPVVCGWYGRYGPPRLDRQLSQQACVEGRTWGYRGGDIWVSNGCRARFVSAMTRGWDEDNRAGGPAWVRDNNYGVVCSSTGGGRTMCTWDDRYGSPRMIEQMSQSACVEGRNWGYDRQGQLWVDSGCRARFGFR